MNFDIKKLSLALFFENGQQASINFYTFYDIDEQEAAESLKN
jgi:hypothetical protein